MIGLDEAKSLGMSYESWFWLNADVSGGVHGCWPWGGKSDYGSALFNGKATAAHRVAYQLTRGEIPDGLFVCHSCDNPPCCNPLHLWAGTHQDNMDDMMKKGRFRGGRLSIIGEADLLTVCDELKKGESLGSIAKKIGISQSSLTRAFARFPHIARPDVKPRNHGGRPLSISPEIAVEIRKMLDDGKTIVFAGQHFGVSRQAIYRALK